MKDGNEYNKKFYYLKKDSDHKYGFVCSRQFKADGIIDVQLVNRWYTNDNIDQMLMERHLNKKARRSSHKNHIKGPKKRTEEDDERFTQSFEKMIKMAQESEM